MADKYLTPFEVRTMAWSPPYSLARMAGAAGVAVATVRIYELDRMAVTERSRRRLDEAYRLIGWVPPEAAQIPDDELDPVEE